MNVSTAQSIDVLLGPSEGRFFGEGFRAVEHDIRHVTLGPLHNGVFGASGSASLTYPSGWSTKRVASDLIPHLSTIDAFVLATALVDVLLIKLFGLLPHQRATAWIRAVEFRAGPSPVESLADVAMTAWVTSIAKAPNAIDGPYQSTVEAAVGGIKMRFVVCHEMATYVVREEDLADGSGVLGAPEERFYGVGYKRHLHAIDQLRFSDDGSSLTARVEVTAADGTAYGADLGGAYRPSVSILDCIVAQSQITQALLYRLDDIDRGDTNTLWMRKVRIETRTPHRPLDAAFDARTRVDASRVMSIRGGAYRSTEFSGCFQGLLSKYSLAHELPASARAAVPAVVVL